MTLSPLYEIIALVNEGTLSQPNPTPLTRSLTVVKLLTQTKKEANMNASTQTLQQEIRTLREERAILEAKVQAMGMYRVETKLRLLNSEQGNPQLSFTLNNYAGVKVYVCTPEDSMVGWEALNIEQGDYLTIETQPLATGQQALIDFEVIKA